MLAEKCRDHVIGEWEEGQEKKRWGYAVIAYVDREGVGDKERKVHTHIYR